MGKKLDNIMEFFGPGLVIIPMLSFMIWGACSIKSCQQNEYNRQQKEYSTIFNQQPIYAEVLEERYTSSLENVEKEAKLEGSGISVGTGGIGMAGGSGTIKYDGLENKDNYTLKVKTREGKILGLSISDGPTQSKKNLDVIINVGSIISFPPGNLEQGEINDGLIHAVGYKVISEETNITNNTSIASKRADRIQIN